jgi:hypothetical protein
MGGPRRPASASNAHVNRQPPNSAALPFQAVGLFLGDTLFAKDQRRAHAWDYGSTRLIAI